MTSIVLNTQIKQSKRIVFDLSRSIDLHTFSASKSKEKAIDGRTSGLISLNETVTWEAVHFNIKQKFTSKITHFKPYNSFTDEMVKGVFISFHHQHLFTEENAITKMQDVLTFKAPLGILGELAERLFLTAYLTRFLKERNQVIKSVAESDKWKEFLSAE